MALSLEERVACSDLYYLATGERIEAYRWNPKAAGLLFDFIHKLKNCSKGFAWITNFPAFPITSKKSGAFLLKVGGYLYDVWKEYKKIEKDNKFNARCSDVGIARSGYPRDIKLAIVGL